MAKRKTKHSYKYPYHITARANNKDWFYLGINQCWQVFCEKLNLANEKFGLQIIAFVLMSNHYHLIAKIIPDHKLGSIMNWFQTSISRTINKKAGRINHVFGGPYKSSLITKPTYYAHVLKYVYSNPVRAGISQNVQGYEYSTLNSKEITLLVGKQDNASIMKFIPEDEDELLKWLNIPLPVEYESTIRRGLRKSEMRIVDNRYRKSHILDSFIF